MNYPFRSEAQEAALTRLPATKYSEDDMPFLFTERYSLSPDYDYSDVLAKRQVDLQGAMDMQYSLKQWQTTRCKRKE